MQKRYDLATEVNAKNILEYNEKVDKSKKWPYIVIIIDELADLMMS
jgi:S-DNA-T family DNA segregation ATPase FtsK/SpoIIIE